MIFTVLKQRLKQIFYRPLLSKILAAFIGGYLFTNIMSLLLFFIFVDNDLISTQTDDVNLAAINSVFNAQAGMQLMSFLIWACAIMWVFYTPTARRAWANMLLPTFVGLGIVYLMLPPAIQQLIQGA